MQTKTLDFAATVQRCAELIRGRFAFALVLSALGLALAVTPSGLRAAEEAPFPKDLPAFGPERPLPVPAIDQSKTPEGLTVWVVKRPGFPKVTAFLAVRGGVAADPKGLEGISEVLAATVKEGTTSRTSQKIAEEMQAVGGDLSTNSTNDAITVSVDGLASGATQILSILADVARNASFPAQEVELAKTNDLQGLRARTSTPEFLANKAFAAAVYGDHPYHTVAPTPDAITAVTPEILKQEYGRRFRPERALLVVAGDLDPAATRKTIDKLFGGWKGQGDPPAPTPPMPSARGREIRLVNRPGSVQSQIVTGRPTVKATDPDYYPLVLANTICAGAFGSRLTRNIREDKGYTYSPQAATPSYEAGGILRLRCDVRNEVTAPTILETFYELDRMGATNPTEEEIAKAKHYLAGIYLLRNQTQGGVGLTLLTNWIQGLSPEALGQYVTKVNAVTTEQIRHAGQTYFTSSTMNVVVVGDETKVKSELAQFGTVTTVQP
jgi:predicted Zn-dependent peptidase